MLGATALGAAVHWQVSLWASALAAGAHVGAAIAETPSTNDRDSGSQIVITGSRIPRTDLKAISPVTLIKSDEIKSEGSTNVEEVLNQLPQVNPSQGEFVSAGST